jgi:predicted Zn-dependent protease
MNLQDFMRSWERAGRWAFVVLPPAQLPATATEDDYVAAAASLERVAPEPAGVAYTAALARWPHNAVALIGLGNIAYGGHRLADAERAYRQATLEHPESGDAWNNLAQVLHESGQDPEALTAARRAVAIGGERVSTYRETLEGLGPVPAR